MKVLNFKSKNFWKTLEEAASAQGQSAEIPSIVAEIISNVKNRGDSALLEYTEKFDLAQLNAKTLRVSEKEIKEALTQVSAADKREIKKAIACVKSFHKHTMPKNWSAKNPHGAIVGEKFYPISRVGLYIPGGQVPLVSTVVMTATIARLAGCKEICVCTPAQKDGKINPHLLATLAIEGISEIYKLGGGQAIAAMALGTKTVNKVEKIFGPGNAFVIEAKRQLFGNVGIDLLPGPSEVLILTDESANAKFVASDLLSQAEHGSGKEKIYLLTTSQKLLAEIPAELKRQAASLTHAQKLENIIEKACYAVLLDNLGDAASVANFIAPEHMELHVESSMLNVLANKITTAGSILLTQNTPTVLGDFTAGPSHTLPTGRTGRFSSGLQLVDFMRRSSFVRYDEKSLKKAKSTVETFARMESLDAHGNSLLIRLNT